MIIETSVDEMFYKGVMNQSEKLRKERFLELKEFSIMPNKRRAKDCVRTDKCVLYDRQKGILIFRGEYDKQMLKKFEEKDFMYAILVEYKDIANALAASRDLVEMGVDLSKYWGYDEKHINDEMYFLSKIYQTLYNEKFSVY
ncbi:MAG: hypothetical protein ACRCTE_05110 [Cellulosilyticaceae bacterium]